MSESRRELLKQASLLIMAPITATSLMTPAAASAQPQVASNATHLLIIDPQNDFCDIPGAALPVPGADADMKRLAALIRAHIPRIDAITLTLDSHYRIDIAHPGFWRQGDGRAVAPFTAISAAQVRAGQFLPRDAAALPRVLSYLDALQARGRYTHMVWPVHCEMGTWGHNLHAELAAAVAQWEDHHGTQALRVFKGMNPWTEHYSAIEAEVPLADDAATQRNQSLLDRLAASRRLLVAGEAGSHCVRATVLDVVRQIPAERLLLIGDAMSPVSGFESQQQEFLSRLQQQGARLVRAADPDWL
jgi:nicotinamidase/pyrazinamidase